MSAIAEPVTLKARSRDASIRASGLTLFATLALAAITAIPASAQQAAPGAQNQGRDCKTVLTCNFTRGAEVRGCLSSYSCRTCTPVAARCTIGNRTGTCQRLSCSWGG